MQAILFNLFSLRCFVFLKLAGKYTILPCLTFNLNYLYEVPILKTPTISANLCIGKPYCYVNHTLCGCFCFLFLNHHKPLHENKSNSRGGDFITTLYFTTKVTHLFLLCNFSCIYLCEKLKNCFCKFKSLCESRYFGFFAGAKRKMLFMLRFVPSDFLPH